ncbi:MAG: hypothetical protein HFI77_14445 [Lachnospiraceae bacterium]|nr:hypothetical protein [Lachnospiraceae bacterium]
MLFRIGGYSSINELARLCSILPLTVCNSFFSRKVLSTAFSFPVTSCSPALAAARAASSSSGGIPVCAAWILPAMR